MQETEKLKLKKPEGSDYADISVLNHNMDVLDTAVSNLDTDKADTDLGNVTDADFKARAEAAGVGAAESVQDNLDLHTANRENPHEVTAEQLGAATAAHGHALTDASITGVLPIAKGGTGAATADNGRKALGAYKVFAAAVTIPTAGWINAGGTRPYTVTVAVAGLPTLPEGNDKPKASMDFALSADLAADKLRRDAFFKAEIRGQAGTGAVVFTALTIPTVAIPMWLQVEVL